MISNCCAAFNTAFALIAVVIMSGCTNADIIKLQVPAMKRGAAVIQGYDNPELLKQALPGQLVTSEAYIGIAPDNSFFLVSTSQTYATFSTLIEDEDPEQAIKLYERGKELGFRALLLNKEFAETLGKGSLDEFLAALKTLGKEDMPALYALTSNWGPWLALSSDDLEAIMDLPKVEACMFRMLEIDETYSMGMVHAMMGVYYGSLSEALGGQPKKAKEHFDKAFELTGGRMQIYHVLYAQTYLVQMQDKKAFVETLQKVLATPTKLPRSMTMANEIAHIKAKALLENVHEYFL